MSKPSSVLTEHQQYAQSLLENLSTIPAHPSQEYHWIPSSLDQAIANLMVAAKKTGDRASLGVKIGILGEFSSGKTSVLGALLGYADALPISENPTTGNVTAIHLKQQTGLQTTKISNFRIEYLDENGFQECLKFMLQEAENKAIAARITSVNLQELWQQKQEQGLLQWCANTWNQTNNIDLRYLIRELVWFLRVYQAYIKGFGGKIYNIDLAVAKEGLKLADPPLDIQTMTFDQLPSGYVSLPQVPEKLTPLLLQKTFPLIRKLDLDVAVSKEIWDLSPLQGVTELILLDFPGLGAANSGARDTFLSLRELAEVQTILILLNGKSPGSDRANRIFTMMQQNKGENIKDRILVGVGRFDQLPLDSEGGEQILDLLIKTDKQNPENILEKLSVLRTTIATAQSLIPQAEKDRIVLLSPLLCLAELSKISQNVQVGTPAFVANLNYPGFLEKSQKLQNKWGLLSNKLIESNLKRQLGDFAEDGGISRLRNIILDHVIKHGLKQMIEDTEKAFKEVKQIKQQINAILDDIETQGIPIVEPPELQTLKQGLETLINSYRQSKETLKKKPLQTSKGITVNDLVKDQVIAEINNWQQWNLLLNKIDNGKITLTQSAAILDILENVNFDESIPTKSEDFYPTFAETIKEGEKFARQQIRSAIKHKLNQISEEIAIARNDLRNIVKPEIGAEIKQKFSNNEFQLFNLLLKADDPSNQWLESIIKNSQIQTDENLTLDPEKIFPLSTGQILDWSPDRNQPTNHQILIMRLREEMIASSSLHLVELVSKINQQAKIHLLEILDFFIPRLQEISKKEDLLRAIAMGEQQQKTATPQWLEKLKKIVN
jgi:Dynamin family